MAEKTDKPQHPDEEGAEEIPQSHAARLGRLGSLAARVGGRFVVGATRRIFSSRENAEKSKEESHTQAAEAIFKTLGEMKGLAMKVGQMLSYVDGAVPPEFQGVYRQVLGKLQSKAPPLPYPRVRDLIIEELGGPPEKLFDAFEETPFAAASIGQVHAARLGKRALAVKVQYPGIDKAIKTELKDAQVLEKMFSPLSKRFNARATLEEIRARVEEELDYRLEAKNQELFAKCFSHWPEVIVPGVLRERSSRRVLSTDLVEGRPFQEILHLPEEERSRLGAILYRFVFEGFYRFRVFNGDPHPGNYLFAPDGRVAFLDYGCALSLAAEDILQFKEMHVASFSGDLDRASEVMVDLLEVDRKKKSHVEAVKEYTRYLLLPYQEDAPFAFTDEYARGTVSRAGALMKKTLFKTGSVPTTPKRLTFLNRMQWGFVSVLGMLSAKVNCHRILREIFAHPMQ